MTEPSFVLSGPDHSVVGHGIAHAYPDASAAVAALQRADVPIVMGALPFDLSARPALFSPERVYRGSRPRWPVAEPPMSRRRRLIPEPAEHRARVRRAVDRLSGPDALHKVVLARAIEFAAEGPWDPLAVLARLADADPLAYLFLADLSAADVPTGGEGYRGAALVGASPELLISRRGNTVTCRPFAGSAPRGTDATADDAAAAGLAASAKDHLEHQLVVAAIESALRPLCTELTMPAAPLVEHTDALWHLSTPISGVLADPAPSALELALALHPTPAVGGVPTAAATELIAELEGDRGFYAGAVGWCDERGDGQYVVSILCAMLSADRRTALAHSGGGIVAGSDPDAELAETTTKFRTIMAALGVAK